MLLYLAQVKCCGVTKYSLCSSHNPVLAIAHHRRTPVVSRVKRSVSAMGVPHPLHTKHSGWYKRVSPADWRGRGEKRRIQTPLQALLLPLSYPYVQGPTRGISHTAHNARYSLHHPSPLAMPTSAPGETAHSMYTKQV